MGTGGSDGENGERRDRQETSKHRIRVKDDKCFLDVLKRASVKELMGDLNEEG